MTIKNRNRINLVFSIIATILFLCSITFISVQIIRGSLKFPEVYYQVHNSSNFLTQYLPYYTMAGILFLLLYVAITSFCVLHAFSKTQSSEIAFFLLFLIACISDTFRMAIPLFHISGTYSRILVILGNIILFSHFFAPLSLLGIAIMSDTEQRKDLEQNMIIIFIAALFFAVFVPINTAKILPNFSEDFGHKKIIFTIVIIISIINAITIFIKNNQDDSTQSITIGFILLTIGYQILFNCYSLLSLVSGPALLISGTILFLNSLHKQYLWNN